MANPFDTMGEEELVELLSLLTDYANCKLVHLRWRGLSLKRGGSIPGGAEASDIAAQAIIDVIDGTRAWDPERHADLLGYLKSVIDSQVSNLVNRAENKVSRRMGASDGDSADQPEYQLPARGPDPYEVVANKDSMTAFRAAVVAAIKDDPLALAIFECLEAEITKPAEMAVLLEKDVSEINNAQKRLRNKVDKVRRKQRGSEGHERHRAVR
jgi:hypothetical protein